MIALLIALIVLVLSGVAAPEMMQLWGKLRWPDVWDNQLWAYPANPGNGAYSSVVDVVWGALVPRRPIKLRPIEWLGLVAPTLNPGDEPIPDPEPEPTRGISTLTGPAALAALDIAAELRTDRAVIPLLWPKYRGIELGGKSQRERDWRALHQSHLASQDLPEWFKPAA